MTDYLDFFGYVMESLELSAGFCFLTGFLQKKVKTIYYILFSMLGTAALEIIGLEGILALLVFVIMLIAAGKLFCRADGILTALYAAAVAAIISLCFGLSNSLSCILFPAVFKQNPNMFGFVFMSAGSLLALLLSAVCYQAVRQCCARDETVSRTYIIMVLLPVLLIFSASAYMNEAVYGNTITIKENGRLADVHPYPILLVQVLGAASLFCIMSVYKRLLESLKLSQEIGLLETRAQAMNQYMEEVKLRYEKTKSFRHDIKNHITIVKELLQNRKTEAALHYIEGMEHVTADLSFPVSTNHPILDILFGNKLGAAEKKQIEVQCSLFLPDPCGISDIDFCAILGNALDNAVAACGRVSGDRRKYIHVTGNVQGDFLFMEIENSCAGRNVIRGGTGLANIRAAVEKYHGVMDIRTEDGIFVLSILVIMPHQLESISQQTG